MSHRRINAAWTANSHGQACSSPFLVSDQNSRYCSQIKMRTLACTMLLLSLASRAWSLTLSLDGKLVVDQLLHLATFSDDPNPAVTRVLFTGEGRWQSPSDLLCTHVCHHSIWLLPRPPCQHDCDARVLIANRE